MNRSEIISEIFEDMASFKRLLMPAHGGQCPMRMPSPSQVGILLLIARQGPQSLKELARHMCMSSSAATQLADGLIKDRLLTRTEDQTDRRRISLALTESGKRRLSQARKEHVAVLAKFLDPLTENELIEWKRLQRKIIDNAS